MNKLSILAILSVFLAAMPVLSTPRVHAQTGVVCIVSSLPTTSCPTAPPSLPVSGGSSLTVALFISGSGSLGGAKLSVKTDPTILNPVAISFTGTVVPSPLINLIDCINGVPVAGSGGSCQAGIDGVGVASLGMISLAAFTVAPTSGLLFTVTYNVLSTRQTGIDVLINSGCAGSSVTGTNDCILISSGAAVVPETALVGATVNGVFDPNAFATAGPVPTVIYCSPSIIVPLATSTCTATVTDTSTSPTTPTGTVSFTSSNTTVGAVGSSCSLLATTVAGAASCSVTFSAAAFGTATVSGTYSGDSTHPARSATSNVITVQKDNTSTAVACSPSTIIIGGTSSCTATVTDTTTVSNTPTGSVTFTSSNTAVGTVGASCTLVSGRCSVTFADVSRGTATVSASYGGDSTHNSSSGTSGAISIVDLFASTSVSCGPSTISVGGTSTCTATVVDTTTTSITPTGSVSFVSSNTAVGTVGASCTLLATATAGVASCSVTFTAVASGTATVTGTYSGNSNFNSSSATSNTITVGGGTTGGGGTVCALASSTATSCGLTPPSFASTVGTPLTVSIFVQGSDSLGGSKVSIVTNPAILNPTAISFVGTVVPAPQIALVDCINGVPVAGSGGSCQAGIDGNGVASLGILSLGGSTIAPTTGLLFTVTYSVLSTAPTGIDVLVNSACAGQSVAGTNDCILITAGAAVVPETALVGATVAGVTDPNALAIEGLPTAAMNTLTSVVCRPSSISISGISTCTATVVDPTTPSNTPIGTVSFVSSNTAVGTVGAACTLVSGSCSVAFTGVSFGTATVTGTYSGDASHSGSSGTSNTITVVKDNTSTSVVCSSATIVPDGTSTCTATVTDTTNAANTPTGSVTFTSSNTTVVTGGSSCTLLVGSCSVTFTGVAPGTSSVTGAYGGDMIHLASSGTFNTVSVLSPVVFSGAKLSWTHHLSLSKTTCSCETWTAKITNPNLITVYAQITVVATDGSGTTGFTTTSAVIALAAGATMAPMILSPNLSGDIGVKFHFTATIMWGRLPTALTNPGGNMKTGSFAVVA